MKVKFIVVESGVSPPQRPRLAGRHRHRWQRPRHRQQRCDTGLVGKGFLKAAASSTLLLQLLFTTISTSATTTCREKEERGSCCCCYSCSSTPKKVSWKKWEKQERGEEEDEVLWQRTGPHKGHRDALSRWLNPLPTPHPTLPWFRHSLGTLKVSWQTYTQFRCQMTAHGCYIFGRYTFGNFTFGMFHLRRVTPSEVLPSGSYIFGLFTFGHPQKLRRCNFAKKL